MNTLRITVATLCLSATAFAQASEITDFPIPTSSTLTRAEVKADTARNVGTSSINYNIAGPAVMKAPAPVLTRAQVLQDLSAARTMAKRQDPRMAASTDLTGGM